MKFEFDTIEEIQDFVKKLKGTRGGKADKEDGEAAGTFAPEPLKPPAGQGTATGAPGFPGSIGFAAPAAGAAPQGAGPFATAATGPAPEVLALVNRIGVRIDGAIASGQNTDQVLAWFRGELQKAGIDAANATMEQIKTVLLVKMPVPALEGIAKLMNA